MASVITAISGLQNLPNLQDFNADYNGLVQANFAGLTNLTTIDISDCDLNGDGPASLTSVNVTGCSALTTLRVDDSDFSATGLAAISGFGDLVNLEILDVDGCGIQGAIDLSGKPNLNWIDISANPSITSVNISSTQPVESFYAWNCGLSQASVNAILTALSLNGVSNGTVELHDGTSAPPSGAGVAAMGVLQSNGWNVSINYPPAGYVTVAATSDFNLDGDFTIEVFVNFTTAQGFPRIYSFGSYPSVNAISYESGTFYVWLNGSQAFAATHSFTPGEWYHIALVRTTDTVKLYVDGVAIGNGDVIGTISSNNLPLTIGYGNEANSGLNGLLSNFRLTKAAVYTGNFSVPTAPLTDLTDTKLLLLQGTSLDAQLTDLSGNSHDGVGTAASYNAANPFSGQAGSIKIGL